MGGLGRPVAPMVGSPTHPVMPNLVMLWKMSPLRGGVRVGARLWAPPAGAGPQLGPNRSPGGLAGPWARHGRRRGASPGLLFKPHNIKGERASTGLLQGQLSRFIAVSPLGGFVGRQLECWCASQSQPPSAAGAELDYVTAASFAIQLCIKARGLVSTKVHMSPCTTSIRVVWIAQRPI